MRRALRIAGRTLARVLLALLIVAASLLLHLGTAVGRRAARDLAVAILPGLVPGRIALREVIALSPARVEVRGLSWWDAAGNPVVDEATVRVTPSWRLLPALLGRGPFPRIDARARTLWARVPVLDPPRVTASSQPPAPPTPLDLSLPAISLRVDTLHNALGGPSWTARNLSADATVNVRRDAPDITLRALRADFALEQLAPIRVGASSRVLGPRRLSARVDLDGPPARCALRAFNEARAVVVETSGCELRASLLSTLASTPLPTVHIAHARAALAPDDALRLDARLRVEGERIDVSIAQRDNAIDATVTPHAATLPWLPGDLPPRVVDGPLRARAARREGGWDLSLDTTSARARVGGFNVPALVARARLAGTRLDLTSLRVASLGIEGSASMDLAAGPSSARVSLSARGLPLDRLAPASLGVRGTADLDLSANGTGQGLRATAEGTARGITVGDIGARELRLRAGATIAQGHNDLRANVSLTGLRAAGQGPMDVTLQADGDPLGTLRVELDASGPLPAPLRRQLALAGPVGPARAAIVGSVRRHAGATSVRVERASLHAGALSLRADGSVDLTPSPSGTRVAGAGASIALPGGGSARLGLAGSVADVSLRDVSLRALAPLLPPLATTGGVVRGALRVDLAHLERTQGVIRVEGLRTPWVGTMSPELVLTRGRDGLSELRVAWNVEGAPARDGFVSLRPPRRLDDPQAWIDGIERGDIALPALDAAAFQEDLGRAVRLRGALDARINLARLSRETLAVEATLDGQNLSVGVGAFGLRRDLIDPMHARVALCGALDRRHGLNVPLRLRAALGVASENASAPAFFGCEARGQPLPVPLVDVATSVEGPWLDALRAAPTDVLDRLDAIPADWMRRLADVALDASIAVGPVVRSRWPLRAVRLPGMPRWARQVLAPEVEPDTRIAAALRVEGTAASPRATLSLNAATSKVAPIGLDAPSELTTTVSLRSTGSAWTDPLTLQADVNGRISPDASPAERGAIDGVARVRGRLAELARGRGALALEHLDLRTQNLRLERFGVLAARGARGGVDVRVSRTDDPARPFDAVVSLRELRAEPPGLESVTEAIPPVGATLHAFVAQEGGAARLRGCLVAGLRETPRPCDPRAPTDTTALRSGEMRVDAELPFPRGILAAPEAERFVAAFRATEFPLDGVGALIPSTSVEGLGGVLSSELLWIGGRADRPEGKVALRAGRATLPSLGEPFHDIDAVLQVAGPRVTIQRFDGRLGEGRMQVEGDAIVGGADRLARINLEARTQELPAVANGNTWAWVTGAFRTVATVRASGIDVDLRVHEARVRVQDEPARALIPLDADPAVFVLGRTRLSRADVADTLPIDVRFEVETPVWLRRSDFAVAVTGRGAVHMDRAGNAVSAMIQAAGQSSWVSFYGKRFEIERAVISLDGSVTLNPQLDLRARHDTQREGPIVLSMQGRLSEPQVALIAEQSPNLDMAEVLQLLLVGRRDSGPTTGQTDLATQAGDMARSLVTGLTLGFVTSTLRAQFAWLPTLIAEPGTSDVGRYGMGFNLGPRVYLQATIGPMSSAVGLGTSTSGGVAQEFRVLLEYAISRALNASATYGTWPQSGLWRHSWGIDLYWSP